MRKILLLLIAFVLTSCAGRSAPAAEIEEAPMTLAITSTAFAQGQPIPAIYSCDGRNTSPPLAWSGVPSGTKSFALIMDDPDAPMGTYVHWVIYNIPSAATGLPEATAKDAKLPDGSVQGPNSSGRTGYAGPCPPGGTHRYFFKLFALDVTLDIPRAGKDDLLKVIQDHILAQGELMGTYSR
jgi:Raf kinase inhibitor-like YbhB/YbcL family protein